MIPQQPIAYANSRSGVFVSPLTVALQPLLGGVTLHENLGEIATHRANESRSVCPEPAF